MLAIALPDAELTTLQLYPFDMASSLIIGFMINEMGTLTWVLSPFVEKKEEFS
jgi:hypothetical protein